MERIDYTRVYREAYHAGPGPGTVAVPPMRFLTMQAESKTALPWEDPAAERLVKLAREVLRLVHRGPMALDHALMPLEWLKADEGCGTLMVMQPQVVDGDLVRRAAAVSAFDAESGVPRLEFRDEGTAVQLLHTEPAALQEGFTRLEQYMVEHELAPNGAHHGIVLGREPRRLILRIPVRPV